MTPNEVLAPTFLRCATSGPCKGRHALQRPILLLKDRHADQRGGRKIVSRPNARTGVTSSSIRVLCAAGGTATFGSYLMFPP